VSFEVAAEAYDRFMGIYAGPLAAQLADYAAVGPGQRALDVGCGPGAMTAELVRRLGAPAVSAIDPSESFVLAARARFPGVDVRGGAAERLPYPDAAFDVAVAQLVVHFMADPVAGLRELARVTRPGGTVAACVWDHAGKGGPLSLFWDAVRELDAAQAGEAELAGSREGHLAELALTAGWAAVESGRLTVEVPFAGFADWWDRFSLGVGPAGAYVASLDAAGRAELAAACARRLPDPPFVDTATAWAVRGQPPAAS
jgi:SAM-dependent methyltransferase